MHQSHPTPSTWFGDPQNLCPGVFEVGQSIGNNAATRRSFIGPWWPSLSPPPPTMHQPHPTPPSTFEDPQNLSLGVLEVKKSIGTNAATRRASVGPLWPSFSPPLPIMHQPLPAPPTSLRDP
ncbi:hypothetical protein BDN72DRAFT_907286 [Pluteus cervinus]|uniref:Uncharacterized protein n=1 Tax=Pluteus cervinus TaxID=181527 RepID=A0ACD2ZWY1_9AGAR|nr:hypothetical protein BDN72DRAFT_907286 [Pluteus cervinus]